MLFTFEYRSMYPTFIWHSMQFKAIICHNTQYSYYLATKGGNRGMRCRLIGADWGSAPAHNTPFTNYTVPQYTLSSIAIINVNITYFPSILNQIGALYIQMGLIVN